MTNQTPDVTYTYSKEQTASVNAFVDIDVNGEVVRFQITSRFGATPEMIAKTATSAVEAFKLLRESYPRPEGKVSPAPQQTTEKKFEVKPVDAAELPEGLPDGIEAFKEDFDEIEITPVADGKVSIIFYRDGMKYPVGARVNKWKNDNAAQILNPLGEFDLTKAAKIRTAGTQYYSKGNEYIIASGAHKGEKSHYKDLRLITARF